MINAPTHLTFQIGLLDFFVYTEQNFCLYNKFVQQFYHILVGHWIIMGQLVA